MAELYQHTTFWRKFLPCPHEDFQKIDIMCLRNANGFLSLHIFMLSRNFKTKVCSSDTGLQNCRKLVWYCISIVSVHHKIYFLFLCFFVFKVFKLSVFSFGMISHCYFNLFPFMGCNKIKKKEEGDTGIRVIAYPSTLLLSFSSPSLLP